jgi:hypothetical protein
MNQPDIDSLKWVRVFTPMHIPKYLVEQVRDRDYTIEDFYKYHEINCLQPGAGGFKLNPFSHLYVLVDPENIPKGFLWFIVDPLSKDLAVQTYSVDKAYWGKGRAVEKLANLIKSVRKKANLKKIYWVTNYPKHSERYGFKRSKSVLMEFTEDTTDGQDIDGGIDSRGEHRSTDAGTEKLPERDNQPVGATSATGV